MQTGNELMLCQLEAQANLTGFRTNKRYAILLEFLGDLYLKVGFCLSGDSILLAVLLMFCLQEMLRWYKQVSRTFRWRKAIGYFDCVLKSLG